MKQLVNYKTKKDKLEEFPFVELFTDREVFADLPICLVDFSREYDKPVLYGNHKGVPTIYEAVEVQQQLAKLKVFHFKEDQGKLTEVAPEEATIKARLPKDTKVDELIYDNGQIVWAKPVGQQTKEELN